VSYTASCGASRALARLAIDVGVHKRGAVTRIERVPVCVGTARPAAAHRAITETARSSPSPCGTLQPAAFVAPSSAEGLHS
jgi:hypothetical protein